MIDPAQLARIENRFAIANEMWAAEVRALYGGNPYFHRDKPTGRGTPGSPLSAAYEARECAFRDWCAAHVVDVLARTQEDEKLALQLA
ncbi:hypothetical protein [Methylobacterium durans]|uniref:Uncharacterized protein n=1 Tax=Methylobacterium durans TaxID=2202825 RepID=A0A2U8W1H7_9HYPH|nr:hypothetical protein [Methylobacterium durans]AWN39944.1 hypothetical protein DK389_04560 [Methylobacterium durans]